MKNLLKIVSIIGLTVITQIAYSAAVTDTFTTGDTLTAEKLNNIKNAVNDNDTRISDIVLTPGPAGADGNDGIAGAAGNDGAAGAAGTNGIAGAAGTDGIAGADGTDGIAGADGNDGAAGAAGTDGIAGADGNDGAAGADGTDGIAGTDGNDGTSCTVAQNEGFATISCGGGTMASVYDGTTATGNALGDMQYWDGLAWVLVPPPADTTVESTLRFVNAKPTWELSTYQIGRRGPAGGFVFYVTDGGLHGLEAAPLDQSTSAGITWGCYEDNVTVAVGTDIGTGAQNTDAIVSFGCDDGSPAALAAAGYEKNGYDDWFLPSKDELNLMWQYLADPADDDRGSYETDSDAVGGFASSYYWSSSQYNSYGAWLQYFGDGFQSGNDKSYANRVRAVRAF
jgi:hypothetical protein